MAQPTKAYILRISNENSKEYAQICADSCFDVGLDPVYFEGYEKMTGRAAWLQTGIKMKFHEDYKYIENPPPGEKAECCSAGHAHIWKTIAEGEDECAIILEHDAVMLHPVTVDIPEMTIVVLGYKVNNPSDYNHQKAGPPTELISIDGHEGAHAYAMTKKTAQFLVDEIEQKGNLGCIDNAYFIRHQRRTEARLVIASPTPALGWLRESTIWHASANRNYSFIPSFQENYK